MPNQVVRNVCSQLRHVWSSGKLVILTSAVVTLSLGGLRHVGALQALELSVYDRMIRLRSDPGPDDRLLVVAITENDIRDRSEYPLKDSTIAQLLNTLEVHQPRAIGLDVIRDVPIGQGREELIQAFQESDRVIGVCKYRDAVSDGFPPPPGLAEEQVGFADLVTDPSGVLRRALLLSTPPAPVDGGTALASSNFCNDPEYLMGSFALSLAARYLADDGIEPEFTETDDLQLGATRFNRLLPDSGPYQNADTAGYQILLNYRSPHAVAPQVTLSDVLAGNVDPTLIKDRVVLVGYTAPSVKDELFTPYTVNQQQNGPMPGVVVHAQIVSQLLSAAAGERSLFWFMPQWGEWLWIWGWSLTGGLLAWRVRHPLKLGLTAAATLAIGYGICFGVLTQMGWIPLIPPVLALVTTAGSIVLIDRFNKTAQAIYKSIKGFLKIDIEIDEAKKEEQVAEITDSTYFQSLEKRADELRSQKSNTASKVTSQRSIYSSNQKISEPELPQDVEFQQTSSIPLALPFSQSSSLNSSSDTASNKTADDAPDYLQQLQQKSENQKRRRIQPPDESLEGAFPDVTIIPPTRRIQKHPAETPSPASHPPLPTFSPPPPLPSSPLPPYVPPANKSLAETTEAIADSIAETLKPHPTVEENESDRFPDQVAQLHREFDDYFNQSQQQWEQRGGGEVGR